MSYLVNPWLFALPLSGWTNNYRGDFNGSEYLRVLDPSFKGWTQAGGRSLEMWITLDDVSGNQDVFSLSEVTTGGSNYGYFRVRFRSAANNDVQIQSRISGSGFNPVSRWDFPGTMTTGVRYHMVLTNTGSGNRMFINGTECTNTVNDVSNWWGDRIIAASISCLIGASETNTGTILIPTTSRIDRVTLWSCSLNNDTVNAYLSQLYNGGTIADPTTHPLAANLQHHWDFENRITDQQGADHMAGGGGWITAINPPGPGNIVPA